MADTIKIDPKRDGPLQVNGTVRLCNSAGETLATETRFWLCRCGGSGNKPFCDGTHKQQRLFQRSAVRSGAGRHQALCGQEHDDPRQPLGLRACRPLHRAFTQRVQHGRGAMDRRRRG